ncbi:putative lipoprotein [Aliivibrio wodanis]|uniref:Putative lipoprotein n=1 Tax=Aliivibrio wodanis TaxID=80852 RepID=A0A090IRP8_9GAMM|nr:putative lipoprotein [Aliivibrio wodanis]VVV03566.1 hypothetical protein AW0309160_00948 [Aliivibrio wodanis]
MFSTIQRFSLLTLTTLLLSACFDSTPTTEQLCEEHKGLQCNQLNMHDGQCLRQRDALILSRFKTLKSQHDLDKLNTIKLTYNYQQCLGSAAQIEPITAKEVKSKRSEALLHTYDAIEAISLDLQDSKEPKVLYYRWVTGDKNALREFLQLEGTTKLESTELQYALATFYTQRDGNKTILILNHALELLTEDDYEKNLHATVIKSLASINHKENNKEHAYIWALVGKEFELQVASEKQLSLLYKFSAIEKEKLGQFSEAITESIKNQNFKASLLPAEIK